VRLFSHTVSGFLLTRSLSVTRAAIGQGKPASSPRRDPQKLGVYNNLKSFFEKQSRFTPDVPDFPGAFISSRGAKLLFPGSFPR
jgi:hypothetical protein